MKKCFNPNCNNLHNWNEEKIMNYKEAMCKSCTAQLALICFYSPQRYDELDKDFLKLFYPEKKEINLETS